MTPASIPTLDATTGHLLVTMVARAMAIAGLAIIIGTIFRAARPSARSLVWNSALLACLITSLVWRITPAVTVPVPAKLQFAAVLAPMVARQIPIPASPTIANRSEPGRDEDAEQEFAAGEILLWLWLAGAVFLAIRFGSQLRAANRFARSGTFAQDPRLDTVLQAARSSLGLHRKVAVRLSPHIDIPLVTGILRPTILLPVSASEWTDDELRIVLLHELAHVRRADTAARAVAMMACAIHWYNPLVWMLNRLSVRDAELAADDVVLHAGVQPSMYADALLNLAGRIFQTPAIQPAVPFARRSGLTERVHGILRESPCRAEISASARMATITASCAIATVAACLRFGPSAMKPITALPTSLESANSSATAWIESATDGLIKALSDVSPQVRGAAAHSLGNLHAQRARRALLALSNDPDKYVRYEVDQALASLDRTN